MSHEQECEKLIATLLGAYGIDIESVEVRIIPSVNIRTKGRTFSSSDWFTSINSELSTRKYAQSVVDSFLDPVHRLPWPSQEGRKR